MAPSKEVIDLTGDDDDDNIAPTSLVFGSARKRRTSDKKKERAAAFLAGDNKKKAKTETIILLGDSSSSASYSEDDEVQIVEAPHAQSFSPVAVADAAAAASCSAAHEAASLKSAASGGGDDVQVVGTKNSTRLPHMRQHCTEHPFSADPLACCQDCYCYVCDAPASECESWDAHCRATNSGQLALYWKKRRDDFKAKAMMAKAQSPKEYTPPAAAAPPPVAAHVGATSLSGSGPWEPNDESAQSAYGVIKCRHCRWYTRKSTHGYANEPSCADWCSACGRVADPKTGRNKRQGIPFAPAERERENYISLGTKEFAFRLHTHDPRKMRDFRDRWAQFEGKEPGWTLDEAAMEQELFDHRFGARPLLVRVLGSVPVVSEDKIPIDGYREETYNGSNGPAVAAAVETEAILLDTRAVNLLDSIYAISPNFGERTPPYGPSTRKLDGEIRASWNQRTRSGTLSVRLSIHNISKGACPLQMNRFLGCWYGVFPFELSDVCGTLTPTPDLLSKLKPESHVYDSSVDDLLPYSMKYSDLAKDQAPLEEAIDLVTKMCDGKSESLSLKSSMSESPAMGGVSRVEVDFKATIKHYYAETFAEILKECYARHTFLDAWCMKKLGLASKHRSMKCASRPEGQNLCVADMSRGYRNFYGSDNGGECMKTLWTLLSHEDFVLAFTLAESARKLCSAVDSLPRMMQHLENRGHVESLSVDGLTVDLLPFQKQSVQWAKERETVPKGIQSFLWTKLPRVGQPNTRLYYNPILGKFITEMPTLARGGIIGEMMGLGKTVISLALVLANPAPQVPASGSKSTLIPPSPDTSVAFRDPVLFERTLKSAPKRGSIVSQGTLVVCNVSLVGQWIDEAKSKLKNPGLVYSYHGHGRKRDSMTLAKNSIVVTTYETLSSDATYHRKKSGKESYCPPCEQVRWWRVICDESHVLRHSNNAKSSAVMDLVADNKWLVSGTPVNTTLVDLDNQFRFLGLQDVPQLMTEFRESTCRQIRDQGLREFNPRRRRHGYSHSASFAPIGHFTFMMRALMMRHAHNQTYTGKGTTLMSLPPKLERSVLVKFSDVERAEYDQLESGALSFYKRFRSTRSGELQKHYLMLIQRLNPLRIACAGGRIPLDDSADDENDDSEDDEPEHCIKSENVRPKNKSRSLVKHDPDDDDNDDNKDDEPDHYIKSENVRPKKKSRSLVKHDPDDDESDLDPPKKKVRKPKEYSKFAFTTKLRTLIEEFKRVQAEDPSAKSLVFSQFTSTLEWLKLELPRHGFQFRTLSGDMPMKQRAKALKDFQNDPPTTVFLLSMRAGAVGINLTQANRVFIMEPFLNPALEAQAIGRVHRLGQRRSVEIVKLIVADSIETRLHSVLAKKFGTNPSSQAASAGKKRGENGAGSDDEDDGDDSGSDDESDDDKKPAAAHESPQKFEPLIGCIQADKSVVAAEEFDCLYGYAADDADDEAMEEASVAESVAVAYL